MTEREQLEQAITIQETLRSVLGDAMVDATIGALRQKLSALEPQAPVEQRKQVTVLFGDISGYTAISETLDAEEVKEMMNALWEWLDKAITENGGTVVAHMGDGVMAVWGAQTAHEEDPERAIRAALAMQRELGRFVETRLHALIYSRMGQSAQSNVSLRMRIGINTGPAILGMVGSTQEFTALGDTTNLASRLEHAAPVGGILISHDTYRHVRGAFDVQVLEPISVKGKSEPIQVYVVERAKPRAFRVGTRGVEGVETRMIGRYSELERLLEALHTVMEDRQLQVVMVLGEAGLGKSRLLYEFNNKVELLPEHIHIFNGRATESMRGLPYSLVRDVFSFRFEILDSDPPGVARQKLEQGMVACFGAGEEAQMRAHFIGHLTGLDFSASPYLSGILNDAKQIRDRAFHYATQFFAAVGRGKPIALYLDDLHWADDGSLDFVDHLARTSVDMPLLILCLARPSLLERRPSLGEGEPGRIMRLLLQPLSKGESRQLVEEILRQTENVPKDLRDLIVSGAEGNPFYLEELIKMLIDQKVIVPGEEQWRVDTSRLAEVKVPPTLTGVLQARLDRLMMWEKTVLQRAAVVGRKFWDSALEYLNVEQAQVAGHEDEHSALVLLRRKELIYSREMSAFAGANEYIFKHAILRDVTYESVLIRERRRYHQKIAEWLIERSGERVHQYAATIAEHYEKAQEVEQAIEWYGRAGQQAREAYAPATAIGFYRKALEFSSAASGNGSGEASRRPQRLQWYEGLAEVLWWQAKFAEAVEAYTAMLEVAEEEGDALGQARACYGLALVQERQGNNRASLESAKCAESLAREAGPTAEAGTALAAALNRQASVLYRLGEVPAAMALGEQALKLSTELGQSGRRERAGGLRALGVAHLMLGHFEQAYSYFDEARALFRELGDRRGVSNMLSSMGESARQRGDYAAAVRLYQEALAIAREIGEHTGQIICLNNLGGARLGLGDYMEAEADLRQVISMAGPAGGYQVLTETYSFLAAACLGQAKMEEALEAAQHALSLGQKMENHELIAEAWRTLGAVAARLPHPITIENQDFTAAACFTESLRLFTESGMEAERARTLRDWARYEQERGMDEHSHAMMEEAREIFTRLGMDRELERMNEGMRDEG